MPDRCSSILGTRGGALVIWPCMERWSDWTAPLGLTTEPNSAYLDMTQGGRGGKCYQLAHLGNELCQLLHYTNTVPFFTSPVDSRLIGCYIVNTNHCTFVTLTCQHVQAFRRGMLIPMKVLEGAVHDDQNEAIVMSMLHEPSSSIY